MICIFCVLMNKLFAEIWTIYFEVFLRFQKRNILLSLKNKNVERNKAANNRKWQEEFNVGLKYNLRGDFVTAIQCKLCKKWEAHIKRINDNNNTCVREGLKCVEKKHTKNILKMFQAKKQQTVRNGKILELRNTLKR